MTDIKTKFKKSTFWLTFVWVLCMLIPVIVLQTPERTATQRGSYGSLFSYEERSYNGRTKAAQTVYDI